MVNFKKVEMNDDELREKKLHLEWCKLQRDKTDVSMAELERHLDEKIPSRLLDDDIKKMEENIMDKKVYNSSGEKIDATDADIARMEITLEKFKKEKELDIPSRELRHSINKLRDAKIREDAPEKQIKKLEKEIREGAYEIIDHSSDATMVA